MFVVVVGMVVFVVVVEVVVVVVVVVAIVIVVSVVVVVVGAAQLSSTTSSKNHCVPFDLAWPPYKERWPDSLAEHWASKSPHGAFLQAQVSTEWGPNW